MVEQRFWWLVRAFAWFSALFFPISALGCYVAPSVSRPLQWGQRIRSELLPEGSNSSQRAGQGTHTPSGKTAGSCPR